MAKERLIKLPQTKGEFKLSGIVTGTQKGDKFFTNKKTKKGNDMNLLNFGVETNKDSTVYISLNGMVRDNVYFYKRPDKKNGETKGDTKKIAWADRQKFQEEGYRLIGVNVGVTKKLNEKGEQVNNNNTLTEYDACKIIAQNLQDDQSVFVKGNIEYSSYKNDKGDIKRSSKFVPNQVSLCKPIDFENEDFKENNTFKQTFIFMGITKNEEDKDDIKFEVEGKIVTYNSIEDTSFVIRDTKLASLFKKNLKPYTALEVWGKINNRVETEETEEVDCWGEKNNFDTVKRSFIRELVITGANPNSFDTETYTEEALDEAVRALKEFGEDGTTNSSDEWGSAAPSSTDDSDDDWD